MDCRTCQPTLLDLAYGELAPELASAVRAHVNGCESCGAAFKALRQGIEGSQQLAWLEPPPSLRVNALAYAEQHVRERAHAAVAAKASSKPRATFVQGLFDFMGRMASGRQFAMATVMVLVAVVGVWVIPELQPLPAGQGVTVVSPDPAGEAAPSGGLAPAEPLDLAVDARSRRIRSREEREEAALAKNAAAPSDQAESAAYAEGAQALVPTSMPVPTAASPVPPPAPDELRAKSESASAQVQMQDEHKRRAAPSPSELQQPKGKLSTAEAFPRNDDELLALGDVSKESAASSGTRARSASPAKPASPARKASGASMDEPLADMGGGAVAEKSARAASSGSSLERARTARRTEGCAAALPAYEQAVEEYSRSMPQSSVLGTALLELAECQFQVGRETMARATLKRAAEVAPVAVRARAILDSEAEGAPKQAPQPAAAPASKD